MMRVTKDDVTKTSSKYRGKEVEKETGQPMRKLSCGSSVVACTQRT